MGDDLLEKLGYPRLKENVRARQRTTDRDKKVGRSKAQSRTLLRALVAAGREPVIEEGGADESVVASVAGQRFTVFVADDAAPGSTVTGVHPGTNTPYQFTVPEQFSDPLVERRVTLCLTGEVRAAAAAEGGGGEAQAGAE